MGDKEIGIAMKGKTGSILIILVFSCNVFVRKYNSPSAVRIQSGPGHHSKFTSKL